MFKREITFKGTVIEYSGSDTKVERINCTDRIEAELILQVLRGTFMFYIILLSFLTHYFSPDLCISFCKKFAFILISWHTELDLCLKRAISLCGQNRKKAPLSPLILPFPPLFFHRSCVWETSTTQMSVTPSTYPSRNTGSSLCGIPQAPGSSATASVRVRS